MRKEEKLRGSETCTANLRGNHQLLCSLVCVCVCVSVCACVCARACVCVLVCMRLLHTVPVQQRHLGAGMKLAPGQSVPVRTSKFYLYIYIFTNHYLVLTSFWGLSVTRHTFCWQKKQQKSTKNIWMRPAQENTISKTPSTYTSFIVLTISNSEVVLKRRPSLLNKSCRYRVTSLPATSERMMEWGRAKPW